MIKTRTPNQSSVFIHCRRILVVLSLLSLIGCRTPMKTEPGPLSRYSQRVDGPPSAPPPGKSLVFFHRPAEPASHLYYAAIWDGLHLVADLGYIQSTAYVCEPGEHVFSSRAPMIVSVVKADLLPDEIYDVAFREWKLKPITLEEAERDQVQEWMSNAVWITRLDSADEYEQRKVEERQKVIDDFTVGKKQGRLLYLAPEDHR